MGTMYEDLEYLNIGKYVGNDPEGYSKAAESAQKVQQTRDAANKNPAVAAQALANQTGGNTMGFTYE